MRVAVVAVLMLAATASAARPPKPAQTEEAPSFNMRECVRYATRFNHTTCIACDYAARLWCESEVHDALCNPDVAEGEEPPSYRPYMCDMCNGTDVFVRNAWTALRIIRANCNVCRRAIEENDLMAEHAVEGMNKKIEKSTMEECGAPCGLTECLEASISKDFNADVDNALACRRQILERCMA